MSHVHDEPVSAVRLHDDQSAPSSADKVWSVIGWLPARGESLVGSTSDAGACLSERRSLQLARDVTSTPAPGSMRRQRPVVDVGVDLYGGSAAAVRIHPARGRWPDRESDDRLVLPICFAALTLRAAERSLTARVRHLTMGTAARMVEPLPPAGAEDSWVEMVAGRRIVERSKPGQPSIVARLVHGRDGLAIHVRPPPPTTLALASCTAVVAAAALSDTTTDLHLAAAIAIDGVLQRFDSDDARRLSPQQATSAGLEYARKQFERAGRPAPVSLCRAIATFRTGSR